MNSLLWTVRVATGLTLGVVLYFLAIWSGPDAEAALAPVITGQSVAAIERSDASQSACFTWHLDKRRPAQIVDAGWTLRAGDRAFPYQEVRTVADSEGPRSVGSAIDRPVKPGQWSRKCLTIPPSLLGRPFVITGFVEYRTRPTGRIWAVRQATVEVSVP